MPCIWLHRQDAGTAYALAMEWRWVVISKSAGEIRAVPSFSGEAVTMGERYRIVHVECYAGYRGEEEPRRFTLGLQEQEVVEILDRWLDPDHRYFKVRGDDDGIYLLRHDPNSGTWEVSILLFGAEQE